MVAKPNEPRLREEVEVLLEAYQSQLDAAAAHGEGEYSRAFDESAPGMGTHEIDAHKLYRRVGRGALAILGYRAEQLLGRPVFEFIVMSETAQRSIDKKLTGAVELKPFVRSFIRTVFAPIKLEG